MRQSIPGLPAGVGDRLHLDGYRHRSTNHNGGFDVLSLLMTVLDGTHSGEHCLIMSSGDWHHPGLSGLALADLVPTQLVVRPEARQRP